MLNLLVPPIKNHLSGFEFGFLNIFSHQNFCVVCHSYCFYYSATIMAQKMSKKPRSIRLLRWFDFSQPENRKTIEKPLKGLPWNQEKFQRELKTNDDTVRSWYRGRAPSKTNTVCPPIPVKFVITSLPLLNFPFLEPSQAPQGLHGYNTSSTEIFLEWTDPPEEHKNGIITEYKVFYKLSSAGGWSTKIVSTPNINTVVSGLYFWSDYKFKVAASTSKGYGPESYPLVTVRTDEDSKLIYIFRILRLFTRSNFWSQLLLKFQAISNVNQHFYKLKQWQKVIG